MVSAHAYLGARGIVEGLRRGADIIICGRVADASPVIAAAWYWYDWAETDYDQLAGALIAGHLIECSAYVTGGNFAGFGEYPLDQLVAPGFPIAEIAADGTCVITKHPNTQGMVNADTVRCQFLYELQGNVYLNSDVSAHIGDIVVEYVAKDRYVLFTVLRSCDGGIWLTDYIIGCKFLASEEHHLLQRPSWQYSTQVGTKPRSC